MCCEQAEKELKFAVGRMVETPDEDAVDFAVDVEYNSAARKTRAARMKQLRLTLEVCRWC